MRVFSRLRLMLPAARQVSPVIPPNTDPGRQMTIPLPIGKCSDNGGSLGG